ncbi:MAG TPA: methyltransferase [Pirellulales bacterium]|nr:methyltransferase [Pirellulales bacterium]
MLSDYRLFLRQYLRHFHHTGAVAPSSRWLAAALARYVGGAGQPRRVLEVGPGTGAVTRQIVARLGTCDRFDLVELNAQFAERLRQRFAHEPGFAEVAARTRVFQHAVEELPGEQPYDVIVSGLPLNNFSVADVEQILAVFRRLLAPGGTLSFFEYIGVRPARAFLSGRGERERLRGVGRVLAERLKHEEFHRERIWPNLPPAYVHHLRSPAE